MMPTQTARIPLITSLIYSLGAQFILLGLSDQNLRLLRQARRVRDAQFWRRNAILISTRTSTHEAFSRARMHGLETDVAFLALRVVRTLFDGLRDGLLILFSA